MRDNFFILKKLSYYASTKNTELIGAFIIRDIF